MEQRVEVGMDYGETRIAKRLEEVFENDAICHRFYSTFTANTLPRKISQGLEIFK
jgi:hypothetical protein